MGDFHVLGVDLNRGDWIAFGVPSEDIPDVGAAILEASDDEIEVVSAHLSWYQRSAPDGVFKTASITNLRLLMPATQAVFLSTWGILRYRQRVYVENAPPYYTDRVYGHVVACTAGVVVIDPEKPIGPYPITAGLNWVRTAAGVVNG